MIDFFYGKFKVTYLSTGKDYMVQPSMMKKAPTSKNDHLLELQSRNKRLILFSRSSVLTAHSLRSPRVTQDKTFRIFFMAHHRINQDVCKQGVPPKVPILSLPDFPPPSFKTLIQDLNNSCLCQD